MKTHRSYQFGESRLTLRFGDITTSDDQVLVSSDDSYISMGGGVSAAIRRIGGEAIAIDASKKVPAALGDIVVTTAGTLRAQYIFHAITIGPNPAGISPNEVVERATRRCMQLIQGLQLSSIAFPAIGAGVAGFSYGDVAATMARVICKELDGLTRPATATIYLFDRFNCMSEMDFVHFFEEFAARAPRIAQHLTPSAPIETEASLSSLDLLAETQEEYKRRRLYNLRRLLSDLEDQRGRLEQQLIASLGEEVATRQEHIRSSLKSNQELRLQYLGELQAFAEKPVEIPAQAAGPKGRHLTVFVSSTYKDLVDARTAVKDALSRCDLLFRGMEHFGASPDSQSPAALIIEEVRKADAYLGIFGVRYGSIDSATGLSMTELEFREAETHKKPMLLYLADASAPVTVADIESDPDGYRKLMTLKAHILKSYVPYLFKGVADLGRQAAIDLQRLKENSD
ncbi:MAG TPA: DUF4062 domain-containing protein [Thermoanaerobaculia bacterium]|nr:DUF4062 domain-containing protein [Thermoanaerobaculia bacterium]